jgi:hypothetical protein
MSNDMSSSKSTTERFLSFAAPEYQHKYDETLSQVKAPGGWAKLQQAFLAMVDEYVEKELEKPANGNNIDKHEAGGQWRIGFSHYAARGDKRIVQRMAELMAARRKYTDGKFFHGFPDCQETHHEIETFIYFQDPLSYLKVEGSAAALDSIEDVAHHVGNWVKDVPAWYDWEKHGFVSTWLGTRAVRNFRPYDYQEANHWRHMGNVMAAFMGTGRECYLDVIKDYAETWCTHIEHLAATGEPIRCSILPASVTSAGEGYGRYKDPDLQEYKVFYSTVASNTAYDVSGVLLDLYRVTGNERYLRCMEAMLDQFYANGRDKRPAESYKEGKWNMLRLQDAPIERRWASQDVVFIARMSVRHDMVTGLDTYKQRILDWAGVIDEEANDYDTMVADLMTAAHYYSGEPMWLNRAYAMGLRGAAVAEADDHFHQCNSRSRQGSKFLFELLYQPMLGGCEQGTRGNIPVRRLRHTSSGVDRLPECISFRTWKIDSITDGFEAINTGKSEVSWRVAGNSPERDLLKIDVGGRDVSDAGLSAKPAEVVTGRLIWSKVMAGRIKPA